METVVRALERRDDDNDRHQTNRETHRSDQRGACAAVETNNAHEGEARFMSQKFRDAAAASRPDQLL
jgi:hypothetical protein